MKVKRNWMGTLLLSVLVGTVPAQAGLYTNNFGSLVTGYSPNDDGTFGPQGLPFSLNFFGTSYNAVNVSNNGNVQFGTNSGSFSPSALNTQTDINGIAVFWTDLDSRSDPLGAIVAGTGGSAVYVNQTSANQVVFTWDRLGYFSVNYSGRAQFQLVLNNPNAAIAAGEGVIGMFWGPITSGSDSHNVSIGFGDGLSGVNPGEISTFSGTSSAAAGFAAQNGQIWYDLQGGIPTTSGVPEPGSFVLMLSGMAGLGLMSWRRKRRS